MHQPKLFGEPLAVLDQSLGQYEPETSHRQLEHSSAPHSGAQGWADFPFATIFAFRRSLARPQDRYEYVISRAGSEGSFKARD
jgi:hypothetical protein